MLAPEGEDFTSTASRKVKKTPLLRKENEGKRREKIKEKEKEKRKINVRNFTVF